MLKINLKPLVFIVLCAFVTNNICAQDEKVNFKAEWKQNDSLQNVISITITNGDIPVNCYIYDSSPFTGGRLIKQVDNIVSKDFSIQMNETAKVYICIFKSETNAYCKWLQIK